jgi:hypothetical protein
MVVENFSRGKLAEYPKTGNAGFIMRRDHNN